MSAKKLELLQQAYGALVSIFKKIYVNIAFVPLATIGPIALAPLIL
jgi:hypothetical protein